MKNYKIILLALAVLATTFSACKKGEDDPALSFRSRKARVVGEWKMTNFKYSSTSSSSSSNSSYVMSGDGSTYTATETDDGTPSSSIGTLSWQWTFEKDGKYKFTQTYDGDIYTSAGTWNFTSGVGDLKKNSQITYSELSSITQSSTSPATTNTWTGNYVDEVYDLKELRNKKMVWYRKITNTYSGNTDTDEIEITFETK